ncbi:hypothetical protein [Kitasatospora sp. NPDC059673]|uniref:hypothetical protein n=1 Tax=Kitasatospora sp. NPDC059673 TaxID=3346901 RepID=UPI00368B73B3
MEGAYRCASGGALRDRARPAVFEPDATTLLPHRRVAALRCGDAFPFAERTGADEPAGDRYVQVRYRRDSACYRLEYRDGLPSGHDRAVTDSPAAVAGLSAWRRNFDRALLDDRCTHPSAGPVRGARGRSR